MKKLYTLILALGALFTAAGQGFEFDSVGVKSLDIGTVVLKNDTWVIKVEKPGMVQYYLPVNMPEKYCVQNQEVAFEGAIGRIPVNVRLVGTPLKLSTIRILYRTKPEPGNGERVPEEKPTIPKVNSDSIGYIEKSAAKIILVGDVYLIEQVINGETKRYVPEFLPDDFKVADMEINFSAIIIKHDPNVRMMGTPIKIKEIISESTETFDENKLQEAVKSYFPFDSIAFLPETKGVIKLISDTYVIEVDNGRNDISRYLPVFLPEEFKKENAVVMISGTIGKVPANVRMMGTPLTLFTIGFIE